VHAGRSQRVSRSRQGMSTARCRGTYRRGQKRFQELAKNWIALATDLEVTQALVKEWGGDWQSTFLLNRQKVSLLCFGCNLIRSGGQLQHGRALPFGQFGHQHSLPIRQLKSIVVGIPLVRIDL
jgi:hypothetical protein